MFQRRRAAVSSGAYRIKQPVAASGRDQVHPGGRASVGDESEDKGKKKGGFFRRLMKLAFIGAIIAAVVQVVKRRRGEDVDDVEWQELPPPAGG